MEHTEPSTKAPPRLSSRRSAPIILPITRTLVCIGAAATMLIAGGTAAHGSANVPPSSDETFNSVDGSVSVTLAPNFDGSAPVQVVTPDGDYAAVVSGDHLIPAAPQAAASCNRNWAAPGNNTWYTSVPGCAVIGTTSSVRVGYAVGLTSNQTTSACVQALGSRVYRNPSTGLPVYVPNWTDIGCMSTPHAKSLNTTVYWGNVAQNKQIKIRSGVIIGAAGFFE